MNRIQFLFALLTLIFFACASEKAALRFEILPEEFAPAVTVTLNQSELIFSYTLNASGAEGDKHRFIAAVDSVYVFVMHGKDIIIEEKFGVPTISGIAKNDGSSAVTMNAVCRHKPVIPKELANSVTRLKIYTKEGWFYYDISTIDVLINNMKEDALSLTPYFRKKDENTYILGTEAYRNFEPEGEYFPDSQTLIVHIETTSGSVVWNSSEGKNFMQMITDVLPKKPGESYKYELTWNGRDTNGKNMKPGNYIIRYTIPAKPESYSATLEIEWK